MTCPICNLENPANAITCDCGFRFDLQAMPIRRSNYGGQIPIGSLPPLWIGYLFGGFVSIAQLGLYMMIVEEVPDAKIDLFLRFLYLPVGIFWLFCIYKLHFALAIATNKKYKIKPVESAIGHLIPIFNLYWIFRWPSEIERFIKGNGVNFMPGYLIGIWVIVSVLLGRLIFSLIAVIGLFGVLTYMYNRLKKVK